MMYYCKNKQFGYVSRYYCDEEWGLDWKGNYDREKLFTRDINKAHVFEKIEEFSYREYLQNEDIIWESIQIENKIKEFCIRNHLGDIQDKTNLTPFERSYLTKFDIRVKWVENKARVNLYENDFKKRLTDRCRGNAYWEKLSESFIENYYFDVYNNG